MRSASAYGKKLAQLKAVLVRVLSIWYAIHDTTWHSFRKTFEYIDTPHKFKMGVSGCPRSCVESGVKDFGIISVENGFKSISVVMVVQKLKKLNFNNCRNRR